MSAMPTLVGEAIRDAFRRRIVAAIIVLSLLSLFMVDGCTSCSAAGEIQVNGEARSLRDFGGATGALLFGVLGLWIVLLAGILCADHLAQSIDDGSANLTLARPVSRNQFATARLAGALGVAFCAGLFLLGGTALLLQYRSGLSLAPALLSAAACALGAWTTGSLAMLVSLWLPRMAATIAVLAGLALVTLANTVALFRGSESQDVLAWIDRVAPPIASALWLPLAAWLPPQVPLQGEPVEVALRAVFWAAVAFGALLLGFRRTELGH